MSIIKDGGPAFPTDKSNDPAYTSVEGGMSLRDYFAGQALIAFGSALPFVSAVADQDGVPRTVAWANASYEVADAMLKARETK